MDCKLHFLRIFLRSFIFQNKVWQIIRSVKTKILTAGSLQQKLIYVQILSLKSAGQIYVINVLTRLSQFADV